jgi:NADH:ubiquinone reductase (H+-translocating)
LTTGIAHVYQKVYQKVYQSHNTPPRSRSSSGAPVEENALTANAVAEPPRIVIVGGGAGGLELATRLGNTLGKRGRALITLVDKFPTHLWKPLLHQVAAGTGGTADEELDYLAQAHWHHFRFILGTMEELDRSSRQLTVAATFDDDGAEISPRRRVIYDYLILAVGSGSNDFGTPGAKENAISLDTQAEARRFHKRLINACIRAHSQVQATEPKRIDIAIIGAGATGVELAAELHYSMQQLTAYGLDNIEPERDLKMTIIEAAPRILPALPERLSEATAEQLRKLGVELLTAERVVGVSRDGVDTQSGKHIKAELVVWAAGIKAPDFLRNLDGLEVNAINQILVRPTLQTTLDDAIFAFGDCAACPWPGHPAPVPPRAQAAHQQAKLLAQALSRHIAGEPLLHYVYRDFGSLVSLGAYSTVGSLMGRLTGGSILVEGLFARLVYLSLHKMHLLALHGYGKVVLSTLARLLSRRTEPQIKLH